MDTEQEYERILRFANRFQPSLVKRVKLYSKETPLFEQFGLSEEINKALKSKVWLKSGGYIVINQTEALVAIDVNTGKYVGKTTRLEDTIVKTNVDAIKEIVRQIRLRDLGGIIIIDFIDMDERRNRQKVMQALEEALRADRAPSKVLQFNDFGLVAITRKRVKQSLERTIGSPCPYCESTGFVKSVTTVCNDIYIEMRKMAKHLEHADVMLRVNPEVAKALKANNGRALIEMEEVDKEDGDREERPGVASGAVRHQLKIRWYFPGMVLAAGAARTFAHKFFCASVSAGGKRFCFLGRMVAGGLARTTAVARLAMPVSQIKFSHHVLQFQREAGEILAGLGRLLRSFSRFLHQLGDLLHVVVDLLAGAGLFGGCGSDVGHHLADLL